MKRDVIIVVLAVAVLILLGLHLKTRSDLKKEVPDETTRTESKSNLHKFLNKKPVKEKDIGKDDQLKTDLPTAPPQAPPAPKAMRRMPREPQTPTNAYPGNAVVRPPPRTANRIGIPGTESPLKSDDVGMTYVPPEDEEPLAEEEEEADTEDTEEPEDEPASEEEEPSDDEGEEPEEAPPPEEGEPSPPPIR